MQKTMRLPESKIITVPSNGQISIGKRFAGVELKVEYRDDAIVLTPGSQRFIPERLAAFFSEEAQDTLREFEEWSAQNPPEGNAQQILKDAMESKVEPEKIKAKKRRSAAR